MAVVAWYAARRWQMLSRNCRASRAAGPDSLLSQNTSMDTLQHDDHMGARLTEDALAMPRMCRVKAKEMPYLYVSCPIQDSWTAITVFSWIFLDNTGEALPATHGSKSKTCDSRGFRWNSHLGTLLSAISRCVARTIGTNTNARVHPPPYEICTRTLSSSTAAQIASITGHHASPERVTRRFL
jgi:hypothetical protein